jgi:hypothetical protein
VAVVLQVPKGEVDSPQNRRSGRISRMFPAGSPYFEGVESPGNSGEGEPLEPPVALSEFSLDGGPRDFVTYSFFKP